MFPNFEYIAQQTTEHIVEDFYGKKTPSESISESISV
jgi:hypothetical protein